MQITGDFFWQQNWAQSSMRKNTNVNPLLEQAVNAIEQQGNAKGTDAASKEMEAKIRQNAEEAKISPEERARRKAQEELMQAEQSYYGDLGHIKADLVYMLQEQEIYTAVMDGTADYTKAHRVLNIGEQDQARFDFIDFDSYLSTQGYQRQTADILSLVNTQLVYAPSSNGVGSVLIQEDQVPYYEQWLSEKEEHLKVQLKEYAAEQMPKLQARIASVPQRIQQATGIYNLKRLEIMEKYADILGEDELEQFKASMGEVGSLVKDMSKVDPADGEKMLDLLNQILSKQQQLVKDLGGVANDVFTGIPGGLYNLPTPQPIAPYTPFDAYA